MNIRLKCLKTKSGRVIYDGGDRPFVDVGGGKLGYVANIVDNVVGTLTFQMLIDTATGSFTSKTIKDNAPVIGLVIVPEFSASLGSINNRAPIMVARNVGKSVPFAYVENLLNYRVKEE